MALIANYLAQLDNEDISKITNLLAQESAEDGEDLLLAQTMAEDEELMGHIATFMAQLGDD